MTAAADSAPRTILIAGGGTGGHLMPALAIAAAVRREHPEWRILLAGANRGVEATLLPTREFPFYLLPSEPLYRRQWWKNVHWLFLARRLLREIDRLLDVARPAVVVGTGGYASGPVVWRAARRGIPTAIQEQNAYPGLATRRLARVAGEIWLGVPEARGHLKPGARTIVVETGNPIVPPEPGRRPAALRKFGLDPAHPVVLVTGGSQGALAINEAVAAWLDSGAGAGVQVLWATGKGTHDRFASRHAPPAVQVFDFLDPMADAYSVADLAISRAGMMTVAELAAWGIPSILIPLPTAAADHQTPNARVMAEAGAAVYLSQAELSGPRLGELVLGLLRDRPRREAMAAAARRRGHPGAAQQIAARIGVLSG
jgi:UDP-N-acetylglucosamine--N-acetylmuramyl-(pentapeptide) pyrophosphoryl-undecaprenol N-acetylglucosamine transferase